MRDDIPQDGEAREPDEEDGHYDAMKFEERVAAYTGDPAFVEAVRRTAGTPLASVLCVDEQIITELERPWDRNNPTNAFGVYESLKAENPKVWVSPEVSLRMFASIESLARTAINEATRM